MLTADLIRVKNYKGKITPRYIKRDDEDLLTRIESLIAVFASRAKPTKADIDCRVEELIGAGTDFLVWRGLAKLLMDRSEFEIDSPIDPVELRRNVFERTQAKAVGSLEARDAVLAEVAKVLGVSAQVCSDALYADLEDRAVIAKFKKIKPQQMLDRYNLALAQACLYRARSMVIELSETRPARLRYLFQNLKFFGLMHAIERTDAGLKLTVDGPASLFSMSRKYGLSLAKFLPALVHMRDWTMVAELDWVKGKTHRIELSSEDGLVSHYKVRGQWVPPEQEWFEERFAKKFPDWELERCGDVLQLDRGNLLVPAFRLVSPLGEVTYAEIISYWRRDYLDRRIAWLATLEEPLILIVAEKLKTSREKLADIPPQVVFYKSSILPDKVVAAAQRAQATSQQ